MCNIRRQAGGLFGQSCDALFADYAGLSVEQAGQTIACQRDRLSTLELRSAWLCCELARPGKSDASDKNPGSC